MSLPRALGEAIERESSAVTRAELAKAAERLSLAYRAADFAVPAISGAGDRAAYLTVRFPATFAANAHVFSAAARQYPTEKLTSFLDLGAGPGTAAFAAMQVFTAIRRVTLIERDPELIAAGRRLAAGLFGNAWERSWKWMQADLSSLTEFEEHDCVVLSYFLGELPQKAAKLVLSAAWHAAQQLLVIVEPGTPLAFGRLVRWREELLSAGGFPIAPCPHAKSCPMAKAGDWCHFSERVERTSEHRQLKGGSLGYEDEKFSYFVAAKKEVSLPAARIVRHPLKHSGHVQMLLCAADGELRKRTVTRSEKDSYRAARKAEWGDEWNS